MAYTAPATAIAGSVLTAAWLNTYLRDNMIAVRAGGIAIASQAALDFLYGSSATQIGRLAKGSGLQAVRLNSGGTAYEFFDPLTPATSQATLDFLYAASATTLGRLAAGSGLQGVRLNSGATAYEFFTPSTFNGAESSLTFTDITTNNVSTSKHGFAPKAPGDATQFLNGADPPAYAVPPAAVTRIGNTTGTSTTNGSVTFGSVAIPAGLTIHDTIICFWTIESVTQLTGSPRLDDTTDNRQMCLMTQNQGNCASGTIHYGMAFIRRHYDTDTTALTNFQIGESAGTVVNGSGNNTLLSAGWANGFSIGIFSAAGVTAGGTFKWSLSVYKVTGL